MFRSSSWRSSIEWMMFNTLFHVIRVLGTPTILARYEALARDPRAVLDDILTSEAVDVAGGRAGVHRRTDGPTGQGPHRGRQPDAPRARVVRASAGRRVAHIHGPARPQDHDRPHVAAPGGLWLPSGGRSMMSGRVDREAFPTVSVVVPTRQRPELLHRALVSILGQRYDGDIEVLVVFDQEDPLDPEIEVDGRPIDPSSSATSGVRAWRARATPASWRPRATTWPIATTTTNGCRTSCAFRSNDSPVTADRRRRRHGCLDRVRGSGHRQDADDRCGGPQPVAAFAHPGDPSLVHPRSTTRRTSMGSGSSTRPYPGATGKTTNGCFGPPGERRSSSCANLSSVPTGIERPSSPIDGRRSSTRSSTSWRGIPSSRDSHGVSRDCTDDWRSPTPHWVIDRRPGSGLGGRSGSIRAERRAYLALCVSSGLVSSDRLLRMAHRTGKGI